MKKIFFLALLLLISSDFAKSANPPSVNQKLLKQVMNDTDPEGLPCWTAETIKKANPELVLLMDTLYRYVRSQNYSTLNFSEKKKWMDSYRNQLGNYYDRKKLGANTVSLVEKANAVLLAADRLWDLDNDESTMGMSINRDTEFTRRQFQEFNEFERLLSLSDSPEYTKALNEELAAWLQLQNLMEDICVNLNSIFNYGGSIISVLNASDYMQILKAHIDLYKNDYGILTYSPETIIEYGIAPQNGKELLLSSSAEAVQTISNTLDLYDAAEKKNLKKNYDSLMSANKNLSKAIDNWIAARGRLSDTATDYQGKSQRLNTGELLVRFANIISSHE